MKNRVISMMLALVMVITAVPAMSIFAFAETEGTTGETTYYDLSTLDSYKEEDLAAEGADSESVARVYGVNTEAYDRLSPAQRHAVISDIIDAIDDDGGLRSFIGTDDDATADVYEDAVAAQLYFDTLSVSKMVIDGSLYVQDGLQFHISFFTAVDGEAISSSTDWKRFLVNSASGMSTNFSITPPDKPRLDENGYVVKGDYIKNGSVYASDVILTDPAYEMLKFSNGSLKSLWYGTIAYNPTTGENYKYDANTYVGNTDRTDSYNAAAANNPTNSGANIVFGSSISSLQDHSFQFVTAFDLDAPALADTAGRESAQALQACNFRSSFYFSNKSGTFKSKSAPKKGTDLTWASSYTDSGATGNLPIKNEEVFDLTFVDDITQSTDTTGTHTFSVYTNTHVLTEAKGYAINSKSTSGQSLKSSWMDIFAIRVYTKALSVDEIKQNHFADLANYYQLDLYGYNTLSESGQKAVNTEMQSITVADATYTTHDEVQAYLDASVKNNFDYDSLRENRDSYAYNHTIDIAKYYKLSLAEYLNLDVVVQEAVDYEFLTATISSYATEAAAQAAFDALIDKYSVLDYSACATCIEELKAYMYYDLSSVSTQDAVDEIGVVYSLNTEVYDRLSAAQRASVISSVIADIADFRAYIGTETADVDSQLYFDNLAVGEMVFHDELYVTEGLTYRLDFFQAVENSTDALSLAKSTTNTKYQKYGTNTGLSTSAGRFVYQNGYVLTTYNNVFAYPEPSGTDANKTVQVISGVDMTTSSQGGPQVYQLDEVRVSLSRSSTKFSFSAMAKPYKVATANLGGYSDTMDGTLSPNGNTTWSNTPELSHTKNSSGYFSIYPFEFTFTIDKTPASKMASEGYTSTVHTYAYIDSTSAVTTDNSSVAGLKIIDTSTTTGYKQATTSSDSVVVDCVYHGVANSKLYANGKEIFNQDFYYKDGTLSAPTKQFSTASVMSIYAIRVYNREINVDEMAQNHLADLVGYYQLDISNYNLLSAANQKTVNAAMQAISVADTTYTTHDKVQTYFDELVLSYFDYDSLREKKDGDAFNHMVDLAKHYKLSVSKYFELSVNAQDGVDNELLAVTTTTYADRAEAQAAFDALIEYYGALDYSGIDKLDSSFYEMYSKAIKNIKSSYELTNTAEKAQDYLDTVIEIYDLDFSTYYSLAYATRKAIYTYMLSNFDFTDYIDSATPNTDAQAWLDAYINSIVNDYDSLYVKQDNVVFNLNFFGAKAGAVQTDKNALLSLIAENYLKTGSNVSFNAPTRVLDKDADGYAKATLVDGKIVLATKEKADMTFADWDIRLGDNCIVLGEWELAGQFKLYDAEGNLVTDNESYPNGIGTYDYNTLVSYPSGTSTATAKISAQSLSMHATMSFSAPSYIEDHTYQIISSFGVKDAKNSWDNQALQLPTYRGTFSSSTGTVRHRVMHYNFNPTTGKWGWSYSSYTDSGIPTGVPYTYTSSVDVVSTALNEDDKHIVADSSVSYVAKSYLNIYANNVAIFDSSKYADNQAAFTGDYWYLNDFSKSSNFGTGGQLPIYAIRVYNVALTAEDIEMNRFADIASFYQLDLLSYASITEEQQKEVRAALLEKLTDGDFSYNTVEVQTLLDDECSEYITDAYDALYVQDGLKFHISFFNANDNEAITSATDWTRFMIQGEGMSTTFSVEAPDKPRLDENGYVVRGDYMKNGSVYASNVILTEPAYEMLKFSNGSLKSLWYGTIAYNPTTGENYKYDANTYVGDADRTDSYNAAAANLPTNSGANIIFGDSISSLQDHSIQIVAAFDLDAPALADTAGREVSQALQAGNFRSSFYFANKSGTFKSKSAPKKGTSLSWASSYTDSGATGNLPIKNEEAFALTFVDDITQTSDTTGTHTFSVYTNTHMLTQDKDYAIDSKSSSGQSLKSSWMDIFAIRVYDKALSAKEIEQNHFADILKYYKINIDSINMLPESFRSELYGIFNDYRVGDNEIEVSELQNIFDSAVEKVYAENEQFFGAADIITFEGYQARIKTFNGLRSLYSIDTDALAELEADGYKVELGAIMAAVIDGRVYSDLQVKKAEDGATVAAGSNMVIQPIYKTGAENDGYVGKIYDDYGDISFAVTITYEKESSQTKAMYETLLMYRAYVAITDDQGNTTVVYVDNESSTFGEEVTMYEVANYFVNEEQLYYLEMQKVIKTCNNALPETSYTINGNKAEMYTIVIDDEKYRQAAEHMQKAMYEKIEYMLPISNAPVYSGLALNLGTKDSGNVWQYNIEVSNNAINLYGSSVSGAMYAYEKLISLMNTAEVMVESTTYSVNELRASGKTYAMDNIFDENGKLVDGGVESPVVVYASLNAIPDDVAASDPIVMVFLGASNSEGGANYFKLFAEAVASTLKKNVVYYNAGVGGTSSNITSMRFYQSAGQYAPDIIVLDENSNDTSSGQLVHQNYTESVMYQAQQLSKVPVVIFNQIPRPNDDSDAVVANAASMIANKTAVTSYYGVANIDIYASMQRRYKAMQDDITMNGTSSEYYATYNTLFSNKTEGVFKGYLSDLTSEYKLSFLGYLLQYYNTVEATSSTVSYNVHPKGAGYTLFGEIMSEYFLADPYRYLSNKIMSADHTLYAPTNSKLITADYTLIGADGTVLANGVADGTKREITYSSTDGVSDWNIYTAENPFTPVSNTVNGGDSSKISYEKITMASGLIYTTPYFADGIAQTYNVSGASFSFKSTADEIGFYYPISGVGNKVNVSVTDAEGNAVETSITSVSCKEAQAQAYGRMTKYVALPGDGAEYTVTFTVDTPSAANNTYLFRFGYIIERNYKD